MSRYLVFPSLIVAALAGSSTVLGAPLPPRTPLGMMFVHLPKGTFYMGWDGPGKAGKKTEIRNDFEIALHPVTQGQWQALMGNNPSWFARDAGGKEFLKGISDENLKQFPVERVSWVDAQDFIEKLNEREKGSGWLYRLPAEAEWEYACRGGATSEEECSHHFYFAKPTDDLGAVQSNCNGDYPDGNGPKGTYLERTSRVDAYPPNKLGLCDMHGNVRQWCQDAHEVDGEISRVARGGCFLNFRFHCRASFRTMWTPSSKYSNLGFRLVRLASGSE